MSTKGVEIIAGEACPDHIHMLLSQMPADMETVEMQYDDVPFNMVCHADSEGNIYDYGFGLNFSSMSSAWRTEQYGESSY